MFDNDNKNLIERKHTALGISSFISSIIFIVILMVVSGLTAMLYKSTSENAESLMSFLGWVIYGSIFLLFVSLFLGIAGMREKNAKKILPIMAITMSAFGIISTVTMIIIGYCLP